MYVTMLNMLVKQYVFYLSKTMLNTMVNLEYITIVVYAHTMFNIILI